MQQLCPKTAQYKSCGVSMGEGGARLPQNSALVSHRWGGGRIKPQAASIWSNCCSVCNNSKGSDNESSDIHIRTYIVTFCRLKLNTQLEDIVPDTDNVWLSLFSLLNVYLTPTVWCSKCMREANDVMQGLASSGTG